MLRPNVPNPHEPNRAHPAALASDWRGRLDRRDRSGGISTAAVPNRCPRRELWNWFTSALVSLSFCCSESIVIDNGQVDFYDGAAIWALGSHS